jgi:hypothetical protein
MFCSMCLFYKKYSILFLSLVFGIHEKCVIMGLSRNTMIAQIFTNLTHKLAFLYLMAYCNTGISFVCGTFVIMLHVI